MRRLASLPYAVLLVLLAMPAAAGADVFGPISLASESATEQAEVAHDPAISGNGEYVAFDGYYDGLSGVWERDLQTDVVEPVAVGEPGTPTGSAELPSISESGQYVSFTTTARLDPAGDTNKGPDVYVRDMKNPNLEPCVEEPNPPPCAYTLASAVNGSAKGLTYAYGPGSDLLFEEESYGAIASGRSALSANGKLVAFVTTAVSDLLPAEPPDEPEAPTTPALQVAVRNLETQSTELVSVRYDPATGNPTVDEATGRPEPVSGGEGSKLGAVYTPGESPPAFTQVEAYGTPPPVGASISADGSTVAWLGQDVGEQARMLAGEYPLVKPSYTEPLWRRIADGPTTPTLRVTGGSDPANPACAASGETILPASPSLSDPCQGPFATFAESTYSGTWLGGEGDPIPRLSADGYTVAFLANAPLVSLGSDFGQGGEDSHSDLYLADMHEGLTRGQALRQLTELASGDSTDRATTAPIVDLGISPDASQVAFTTKRTEFPLGSPAYVSAPAATPGMLELFDVDLDDDTLTRVTHGFEGGASEHPHPAKLPGEDPYEREGDGALSPSFTDDGQTLAFSSTASNLVYGDGNTPPSNHESAIFDGSDAFVVSRVLFGATPTSQSISGAPANPSPTPSWRLGVTALSRRDGSVVLYVQVPGAGVLRAGAQGAVLVGSTGRTARRTGRSARRTGRGARRGGHGSTAVLARNVAVAAVATNATGGALMTLTLKLLPRYRALAERGGLSATAYLTFVAAGHPALRQSIPVTFLLTATPRSSKRGSSKQSTARRSAANHSTARRSNASQGTAKHDAAVASHRP
jgi:hypothetical protein